MSLVSIPAQQHPFGIGGQPMRFVSPGISQIRPVWKALKRLFAATGTPADREYERLLESSGGKFTDSLERTAERHMNGYTDHGQGSRLLAYELCLIASYA